MCVFVWVFERGSLATPFLLPSKMKCLFHTVGEILGAPYESVGLLVKQFWYLRVGSIGHQASTIIHLIATYLHGPWGGPCGQAPPPPVLSVGSTVNWAAPARLST
jgi:hypothetical protein